MRPIFALAILFSLLTAAYAGKVEKTYYFSDPTIVRNGDYQSVSLGGTLLAGLHGEPMLAYKSVALMLPPGEKAVRLNITLDDRVEVPGTFDLYPQQYARPLSEGPSGEFIRKAEVYRSAKSYPSVCSGHLMTSYLNGYAFGMTTFTPMVYIPAERKVYYYRKVTVSILTRADDTAREALKNLTPSSEALKRVRLFTQNPEMMTRYPAPSTLKTGYQVLVITPAQFQAGFQPLIDYYGTREMAVQVATTESIASMAGTDLAEKMRNYIIQEYQSNGIEHVILGGDAEWVPFRGMYCYVVSGGGYESYNIPADIYFSALDGNWNTNNNFMWGEPGEDDLLPEISVGRMSFSDAGEQANMVHKSVSYQGNPVQEEMKRPYMVSEFLYDPPLTWGSDYLDLLIDDHSDNGYFTYGIPSVSNQITKLYDNLGYNWSAGQVISGINQGKSFIHHCGHANSNYMMRLYNWDITDANFSQVDGITHNYQLMYTHGCICGAFDDEDCIAERGTAIANWLVGGVFNSRYGWFNQGQTEGPSAHLHREFISALYYPNADSAITELGAAHTMSKIKTAPWVGLPGEFEPGAQRWCHYDCNVLGDPALRIWTGAPQPVDTYELAGSLPCTLAPNPATGLVTLRVTLPSAGAVEVIVYDARGRWVMQKQFNGPHTGANSFPLEFQGLAAGIYQCRISASGLSTVKKVVVL